MGIDIELNTDADDLVYDLEYNRDDANFYKYNLSRGFCRILLYRELIDGEPELDQIARLTDTDVSEFYKMEAFFNDQELSAALKKVKVIGERKQALQDAIQRMYDPNIDRVLDTVNSLIQKLSVFNHFAHLLTNPEAVEHAYYFNNFNTDIGNGYIGNNFGQDLRNFKRFLEYAKSKGATMAYFRYE
ncbi:hypothetical protein CLV59_101175 [Chitinophaga dinghuensis]|uniref:Uncharacterized protein n=1 Tax=Chitinophaga dinghuensis TaxID=1539050 RepID=A0A327W9Z6_9BACT|nr:hypothetical protein [Chitinophaga dinghuensis]RAJ87425.1 hypothetical protein CLV59_101175 [Chitinophaga dinghuensis]